MLLSNTRRLFRAALFTFTCVLLGPVSVPAIEYVFPPEANVFDVTKAPYNVDNSGATDVSASLSAAIKEIDGFSGWGPTIAYLPNGTYLVRNTVEWNFPPNTIGPHMVGQSRSGTVVKLAKGTWPEGNEQRPVIHTGNGVEQNFNKGIHNLTVLVDSNNAGAVGIVYVSNNCGMMSDVDVISADGGGIYGIMSAGLVSASLVGGNGPFIIRRTYIRGFAIGFRGCASQSETMSEITVEGQSTCGILVSCGNLTLDGFHSNNSVRAISSQACLLVTDAVLEGGSAQTYGIYNTNNSGFFRNIQSSGYHSAVFSSGEVRPSFTSYEAEYVPSGPVSLFPSPQRSINLPAKYPPEVAWENDFGKWAFPSNYQTGGRSDVQLLQAAIDDPSKTTVCLPFGDVLDIDGPVYVRGTINRIIATGGMLNKVNSQAQLVVDDGTAPVVMIQKVSMNFVDHLAQSSMKVVKRTSRTLVLESASSMSFDVQGGGETYVVDQTSGRNYVDHPDAKVYLWQWEGACCEDSTLTVRNGTVRSVGYYDEGSNSMIFCLGGTTEMLGYWDYNGCYNKNGDCLITVAGDANVSAAGVWQQNFCDPWAGYTRLVSETRNGTTRFLGASSSDGDVASPAGGNIGLFTAYDSTQVPQNVATRGRFGTDGVSCVKAVAKTGAIEVTYRAESYGRVTIAAFDMTGRLVASVDDHATGAGVHRVNMSFTGGKKAARHCREWPAGPYALSIQTPSGQTHETLVVVGGR